MSRSPRFAAHPASTAGSQYVISRDQAAQALANLESAGGHTRAVAEQTLQRFIDERNGKSEASASTGQKNSSPAKAASAPAYSAADVGLAHGRGVAAERARVSAVFASEHSRGRERASAQLLSNTTRPAAEITDFLASEPLDKDRAATGSRESSQAAWDKVNARIAAENPHMRVPDAPVAAVKPAGEQTASQARWEKANAKVASTDDVWARAYGEK